MATYAEPEPSSGTGITHLGDQLALGERRHERPERELGRVDRALAGLRAHREPRSERDRHGGHVRRRVGVREPAADRAEVAHLEVADAGGAIGERSKGRPRAASLELVPRGHRADHELAVTLLDPAQAERADVDDDRRPRDAELHRGEERLAAREELRVGCSESVERLLDGPART